MDVAHSNTKIKVVFKDGRGEITSTIGRTRKSMTIQGYDPSYIENKLADLIFTGKTETEIAKYEML